MFTFGAVFHLGWF